MKKVSKILTLLIATVFILSLIDFFISYSFGTTNYDSARPYSSIGASADAIWWNASWHYRLSLNIHTGAYNRVDVPVEKILDFTSILSQKGVSGEFDNNSVRVIEYDVSGNILWEVPSQFDKSSDYDPWQKAAGTVVWIMNGTTPEDTVRTYHVYFDILANGPKDPPNYSGVSYETIGNYVLMKNENIKLAIRYRNGTYIEQLYFDKNHDGVFDSGEGMIGTAYPYSLFVRFTGEEQFKHGWADPFFETQYNDNATLTPIIDGPVMKEIGLSNITLRNKFGEASNITAQMLFRMHKLSTTVYMTTKLSVNESSDVGYSYEYDFLDHQSLYDKWYIDETYNGKFAYTVDYNWFFSGKPAYNFVTCYNSSGNGGLGFVPDMTGYYGVELGEYRGFGPALRFDIATGTWNASKEIQLKNRFFAYLGDWKEARQITESILNPTTSINLLRIHVVDSSNNDLAGAQVKAFDAFGRLIRTDLTNSTGWVSLILQASEYNVTISWLGVETNSQVVSLNMDTTVDPFECAIYKLTINVLGIKGNPASNVNVGVYSLYGTRIAYQNTTENGSVTFPQLPTGIYVVKTYYSGEQFGASKSIKLSDNAQVTISEKVGLDLSNHIRYDFLYGGIVAGFAVVAVVVTFEKGFGKIRLWLLIAVLLLSAVFAAAYLQNKPFSSGFPTQGLSGVYDFATGWVGVGDIVRLQWKDVNGEGQLEDSNIYMTSYNDSNIAKIDLQSLLVSPSEAYPLFEAKVRNVFFFDKSIQNYTIYKPLSQQPDFANNRYYQTQLKLKFAFSEPGKWEVNLICILEQGKPYIKFNWEIVDKGEGAGTYALYPEFVLLDKVNRFIIPANYTENDLFYWNQKNGPGYGNPWAVESDYYVLSGHVGSMEVHNENVVLHSATNYKGVQTKGHASSLIPHLSNWVQDVTSEHPYFQFDFWVSWKGSAAPSSDVKIEVWVPDLLDLKASEISYSTDGKAWNKYAGWTMSEGNRGEEGFSSNGGVRHRVLIDFPASSFTAYKGVETGKNYGDPHLGNDEYLVRLKIAYLNNGLATYEFENSSSIWYGLKNMNDAWMWLVNSENASSVGLVASRRPNFLTVVADDRQMFQKVASGFSESLENDGRASFYTNLVMFSTTQASKASYNPLGIWNMFDYNLTRFFSGSAIFASRETLGEMSYEEGNVSQSSSQGLEWLLTKRSLVNDWNTPPEYWGCLPSEISRHFEGYGDVFLFERYGYYVYDVSDASVIRWDKQPVSLQSNYLLYAVFVLVIIALVLAVKSRDLLKKHWSIVFLFSLGLTFRLFFQSLSTDFSGSDAAFYANVAQNMLAYGKIQTNFVYVESHYLKAGLLPPTVTGPFTDVGVMFYPFAVAFSFVLLGDSYFAIKAVDLILGVLIIFPTFYFTKKLFDEKTAVLATLIVALHPLLIYFSGVHPGLNILPAFFGTAALCSLVYESKKAAVATGLFTGLLVIARLEYGMILAVVIGIYYLLYFGRRFWRQKNLYVTAFTFLAITGSAFLFSYMVFNRLPFYSVRQLGGGLGQTTAPTLWETLTNPDFVQIRIYNGLYNWWYLMYQENPFIFVTAVMGILLYLRHWRKLSSVYLFPLLSIAAYAFTVRAQPAPRFIVQYIPLFAVMSSAFIIKLLGTFGAFSSSNALRSKPLRKGVLFKKTLPALIFMEIIFLSFFGRYVLINTAMEHLSYAYNNGDIYQWIRVNTSSNSVLMAYGMTYTYYTGREVVRWPTPIPSAGIDVDLGMVITVVKYFNVDYLVLDRDAYGTPVLRDIFNDPLHPPYGFTLVYWAEDPAGFNPRILIFDVTAFHS